MQSRKMFFESLEVRQLLTTTSVISGAWGSSSTLPSGISATWSTTSGTSLYVISDTTLTEASSAMLTLNGLPAHTMAKVVIEVNHDYTDTPEGDTDTFQIDVGSTTESHSYFYNSDIDDVDTTQTPNYQTWIASGDSTLPIKFSAPDLEGSEHFTFWGVSVDIYTPTISVTGGGATSEDGMVPKSFTVSRDFPTGYGNYPGDETLPDTAVSLVTGGTAIPSDYTGTIPATINLSGYDSNTFSVTPIWKGDGTPKSLSVSSSDASSSATLNITSVPLPTPSLAGTIDTTENADGDITLNWSSRTDSRLSFEIQRSTSAGFLSDLLSHTAGGTTTTYCDTGTFDNSRNYYYRIRSLNGTHKSGWSNVISPDAFDIDTKVVDEHGDPTGVNRPAPAPTTTTIQSLIDDLSNSDTAISSNAKRLLQAEWDRYPTIVGPVLDANIASGDTTVGIVDELQQLKSSISIDVHCDGQIITVTDQQNQQNGTLSVKVEELKDDGTLQTAADSQLNLAGVDGGGDIELRSPSSAVPIVIFPSKERIKAGTSILLKLTVTNLTALKPDGSHQTRVIYVKVVITHT